MKHLIILFAVLLLGSPVWAAGPQDILLVTNEPSAEHPFEDQAVHALKTLRQEQGVELKIWTYRFRNPAEKAWCENNLQIHAADLPMMALVPAGVESIKQVDHRVVQIDNPTLAAMGLFEAAVQSRHQALKPLVSLVTQAYPQVASLVDQTKPGGRIAVGLIGQPDGQVSDLSYWMAEHVESDLQTLSKRYRLTVVNRADEAALAKSWGLTQQDMVRPDASASAHQLLDINYLVFGEYQRTDKDVSIHLRLVDAHQQAVLATADVTVPRDARLDSLMDAVKSSVAVSTSDPTGAIKVWTDKPSYHVGDTMTVKVQAAQDLYLTLVDVGSSGHVTVLFPNFYHPDSRLKAGETYTIPSPDMGFDFQVQGPPGREFIRAIASSEPNLDVTSQVQALSVDHPFSELKESALSLTRDIAVKARHSTQNTSWSDTVVKMEVNP